MKTYQVNIFEYKYGFCITKWSEKDNDVKIFPPTEGLYLQNTIAAIYITNIESK